jgi:predicted Zn-dependent protease
MGFMLLRRLVGFALCATLLSAATPLPAAAGISTGQEVQVGKEQDKQVTDQYTVVTDPLLNSWVNGITAKLWTQVARKDVPYNIKVLDVPDINAFSTLGGYVYVNEGTLDFVQSDDELAGVLAHETGHIERRHAVTSNNKAQIVNILLGVGSMFSPILYRFGQLIEAGAIAKIERTDETEADKYGLMLMSRAGYDPDAMVSMMQHLGAVESEHNGLLDKYLADHPDVPNRVAHLEGYPELDPTKRTEEQREAAALHNLDEARYAIAARELGGLVRTHPDDTLAMYELGEADVALGETTQGEQSLADAAAKGTPQTRTLALNRIAALRDSERRMNLLHPSLQPLRDEMAAAEANETAADTAIALRRQAGRDQLKAMSDRIEDIAYEIPDLSRVTPRRGSRLDAVLHNLTTISRSLDTALGKAQSTIGGVGSLEHNHEGGLLRENSEILGSLAAPLRGDAPTERALATFAYYPRMIADIEHDDGDMVRAIDASRAALAMLDVGLGDLDEFVKQLTRVQFDMSGDISALDYKNLEPLMAKAAGSIDRSAVAASQANQLYMMARSRQLMAQIDDLGLAASPERYATLQKALDLRFANDTPGYDDLLHQDLTPGQVAAASIVAADTNVSPAVIEQEAQTTHRSIVDVANERGMPAETLEIMLGLVYMDYADDPDKEAHADPHPHA